jgi:hypothetical protein
MDTPSEKELAEFADGFALAATDIAAKPVYVPVATMGRPPNKKRDAWIYEWVMRAHAAGYSLSPQASSRSAAKLTAFEFVASQASRPRHGHRAMTPNVVQMAYYRQRTRERRRPAFSWEIDPG